MGVSTQSKQWKFKFGAVDKQCETYNGINVRLRYFVRLVVIRNYNYNITKEVDMVVQNLYTAPDINNTIKMEVGIEDCLHIEFEYDKSKYHMKDVVVGKVYFLLVKIKIKHMELNIVRRETLGGSSSSANYNNQSSPSESETLSKFEI